MSSTNIGRRSLRRGRQTEKVDHSDPLWRFVERDVEGEKRASQQKNAGDTRTVSVDPRKRASVMEDVPGPRAQGVENV